MSIRAINSNIDSKNTFNSQSKTLLILFLFVVLSGRVFSQTNLHITLNGINNINAHNRGVVSINKASSKTPDSKVLLDVLLPSLINFPGVNIQNAVGLDLNPGATSTNTEMPIVYTSSNPAVAIIGPDGFLLITGPGQSNITASQNGNANYSPAQPVTSVLTVIEDENIIFPAFNTTYTCTADFPAGATSYNALLPPSTIPITYSSSNPAVATISVQGIIHILTTGTTIITANEAGSTFFQAALPQSQTLVVSVPPVPLVSIVSDQAFVCSGSAVNFTASVGNISLTDNLNYQWQFNGVNVGGNSNKYSGTVISQTDIIKCTVTDNTLCGVSGFGIDNGITVSSNIAPSVSITSSATLPVCSGSTITFTAISVNGGTNPTYQWQVNGVNSGTNSNQFTSNNFAYNDRVTCTISNNNSPCLISQTAISTTAAPNITPPANPSVTITASANGVYPGTPITFTANALSAGKGLRYQWEVNGENVGTNSSAYTSSTFTNSDNVSCVLFMSEGCIPSVASNDILIDIVLPPSIIKVVNTFTPNGDGINDYWDIPGLINSPDCLVTIFTRYGTQIFQSRGYNKPWDGTYNGKQLPGGVYYYLIDLNNEDKILSGYVTIIR